MTDQTPPVFFFSPLLYQSGRQFSQVVQRSRHPPRPSENLSAAPRGTHVEGQVGRPRASVFYHRADLQTYKLTVRTASSLQFWPRYAQ